MAEPFLIIEQIILKKANHVILQNINLTFSSGEIHVLLGLNGSGKSSLAYTLMGCEGYRPTSGKILLEGKDITGTSITERARLGITLAWQEPVRFEGLPIGKYVGLGASNLNREKVVAAMDAVSLPAKTYGYRSADQTLSGGERKRVELASVFAMQPRLAILDEPDSGIDSLSISDIAKLIQQMANDGTAVLLITHRPELVAIGDAASLMCLGSIVFTGEPDETNKFYQDRCQPHLDTLGAQPWTSTKLAERQSGSSEENLR